MRRPLKPFVTEYKQSGRRPPMQQPTDLAFSEVERPAPKPFDPAPRDPEDSYEAAMRAADALFSVRPPQSPPDKPPATVGSSESATGADYAKPEANGGRILRVLDEQPSHEFAALEAERAPKRRGRKPGSKNRPKFALLADQAEPTRGAEPPLAAEASLAASSPRGPAAQLEALVTLPKDVVPRESKRSAPWTKGRLRPGEEWKRRRLPRVCW